MTCIVGYLDLLHDCSWIGGDSLGSNRVEKAVYLQPKVFRHELFKNILMGSTTTFRHIDLLRYSDTLFPEIDFYKNAELTHKYMVTQFIPNLITLFTQGVVSEKTEDRGADFILCTKNAVFRIQSDFSVLQPSSGFASVGCGSSFALGSLYSTKDLDIPIPKKIEIALESAEQCGCGVQRPFTILNTSNEEAITIT